MGKPKITRADLRREKEANEFALCLLMPRNMFVEQWQKLKDDKVEEEQQMKMLAKIFQVPESAAAVRMAQLGEMMYEIVEKYDTK